METSTARVVGPRDGKAGFLGSIGVRFMIDGPDSARGSRWSNTRCPRERLPPRSIDTTARTSTATSWKDA